MDCIGSMNHGHLASLCDALDAAMATCYNNFNDAMRQEVSTCKE
jgi:hypothetical protein